MEVFNSTISGSPQIFSRTSIFSPKNSLTSWRNKNSIRFNIPTSKFPLHPPFLTNFRISAHFGRPSNRRNSLRKKFTQEHQPGSDSQNPFQKFDDFDSFQSNLDNDNVENSNLISSSVSDDDIVESDYPKNPKSKVLGESVLWNKLEGWVDQYKNDSEFWGIGFGPIFTVFQDSDGNVKRVVINEDEILKRSHVDPSLYEKNGFEDSIEVNSKISQAKFLAREIESGDYKLPKNSSIAKFIVSGGQSGFVSAFRGVVLQPGLVSKLSRVGIMVLCGFVVFGALKMLVSGEKDKDEYTRLEKEMLRRKIKARKAKESLVKGSIEVIQDSPEPEIVSVGRPLLDKQELMKSISKSKTSREDLVLHKSSSTQATDSEFDYKIQEIRSMARQAREIERRRNLSPGDNDGEDDDQNSEETSDEDEGVVSFPNELSSSFSSQTRNLNGTIKPISVNNRNSDETKFISEVALVETSDVHTSNTSSAKVSEVGESISPVIEVSQSSNTKSYNPNNKSTRAKPRVIRSVQEAREFLSEKRHKQERSQESQVRTVKEDDSILSLPSMNQSNSDTTRGLDKDHKVFDPSILGEKSDFTPSTSACEDSTFTISDHAASVSSLGAGPSVMKLERERDTDSYTSQQSDSTSDLRVCKDSTLNTNRELQNDNGDSEDVKEEYGLVDHQRTEAAPLINKENWVEKNFHEFEPVLKKIGSGFRDNYKVAKEKVREELNLSPEKVQPGSAGDDTELEWMKEDKLREIVFQVRDNELTGRDPFYLMDEEDKLAFFNGLEKKVERENEKLVKLHEWVHSNIENLDYGADGISLYDPPEKIIPRWKGPPIDKNPEFLEDIIDQKKALFGEKFGDAHLTKEREESLQKSKESPSQEDNKTTLAVSNQDKKNQNGISKNPKTIIESSDGSVRAGKKSGKEYWEHTKKWSRGFLESYNAENDPEVKAVMKDIGKDLDRWITEKEVEEAADLMNKIPEKGRKFVEKKLNKVKREMELFGPQAVVSKYQEYGEQKEEDYLWWLDLPFVLCIELYTTEDGAQKIGFYSLEMAADLELQPKQFHVIAFEDTGDCKNFCYIMQAHMEMLGNGNAFVVARPPKDAFREAKENGFSVTVIRKGEIKLNIDQTLEEVEEQITEIGSKIYHDKIMGKRSVDISSLMKGVFGASKPSKRRKSKKKLNKKRSKR